MTNLINQLLGDFRGDTLKSVSTALGETPAKTQTALSAVVPALVGGLANRVTTAGDANALLELIRGNHFDSGQFTDPAVVVNAPGTLNNLIDTGRPLLDSVFGSRTGSVADWVSSLGGISRSSASALLGLALPLVLGQIGRQVKSAGWNAANLMSLLAGQRSFLQEAPAGLAGVLTGSDVTAPPIVAAYERQSRSPVIGTSHPARRRRSAWVWILPLLLMIGLLGYYFAQRNEPAAPDTVTTQPGTETAPSVTPAGRIPTAAPAATTGAFITRTLPYNVTLRIPANGVESKLLAFIDDPSQTPSTETWFSFDRLEFQPDSTTLTPESMEPLRNVAAILKVYPQVRIKIGGYTDNEGDAAYNLKLSQERAINTMNTLASLGVDPARMEAEGYGQEHPVADNSTAEGRQQNRRIDIRVTDK